MDKKESYIINKLEQLNAAEQDAGRAQANIDQVRVMLEGQSREVGTAGGSRWWVKAAAAIIIVAGLLVAFQAEWRDSNVAWADVVKQFNSINFFNASVYMKDSATEEPKQIEIWRNSQKKARLRVDGQVLFSDEGDVIAGFAIDGSIRKLQIEEYDAMGMAMARTLLGMKEFTLDNIIATFGNKGDKLEDMTPLINPAAMISEDMLVFDVQSDISPEWVRIWVLRESRLPVRLRSWDPRFGGCVDAVISYSKEQSPAFFDPAIYETVLNDIQKSGAASSRANLAYALLEDAGGKDYTPKDLYERAKKENEEKGEDDASGYHMPTLEGVGVTENGAVWVIASQSMNRMASGVPFSGYVNISNDLGTRYHSQYSSHITMDDVSVQVWVPDGYPFDERRPGEIRLRCAKPARGPYDKEVLIGNVVLDEWQEGELWPEKWLKMSEIEMVSRYAWSKTGDRAACEKIIEMIQEHDPENMYGHKIKRLELKMLIKEKDYAKAAKLAEEILPEEEKIFENAKASASYANFYDIITAIAGSGDVDQAVVVFAEIKQLETDLSQYSSNARKHIMEGLQRELSGSSMYSLIRGLFSAGLDLNQVNRIVGFNLLDNEETKWRVPEKFRRAVDPKVIQQNAYMKKLIEYYIANPLKPGEMVLNECRLKKLGWAGSLKGVKNHSFYIFNMPLHDFLKGYKATELDKRSDRVRIDKDIDNPMLQHEIIYNSTEGFQFQACREFLLDEFGLEAVESEEEATVWVAHYDGSERRDYRDVTCPVKIGSTDTPGIMTYMFSTGMGLESILDKLAKDQGVMIVDETGIDPHATMTLETANFKTAKGKELAEEWFKANFGITFTEEVRRVPVWRIRKKP